MINIGIGLGFSKEKLVGTNPHCPGSPCDPNGLNNQPNGPRVTHCQNLFSDYSSLLLNNCLVKNFQNHHVWVECTAIKEKNIIGTYTLDTIQDFFSNFRIKWQLN